MPSSNPFSLPNNRPNSKIWNGNAARPAKIGNSGTPEGQVVLAVQVGAALVDQNGMAPTAHRFQKTVSPNPSAARPTPTPPISVKPLWRLVRVRPFDPFRPFPWPFAARS